MCITVRRLCVLSSLLLLATVWASTPCQGELVAHWTLDDGTYGPLWVDGASIFMISDRNELLRVSSSTGEVIWREPLPFYVPVRRESRLKDAFVHYGPIIAGNRLIVASDDQLIRVFNPQSGALQQIVPLPGAVARNPVVAGGVLYIVTADGRLLAFR